MRKSVTVLLVGVLLVTSTSTLQPSLGEEGDGAEIGTYQRVTENNLSAEHISNNGNKLIIEAPAFTSELKVRGDFLEAELGPWAADTQFISKDGMVVFDGRRATFMPFELRGESVFTWGHEGSIRFVDRPMWVSIHQEEYGESITLDVHDGDPSGQLLYIAKQWLLARGIHRPEAVHEDGTILNVTIVDGGWLVDVHHFSEIRINPPDLMVKGRQNDLVFPHAGEKRWFINETYLEVDVSQQLAPYEVLIESDWADLNLLLPVAIGHNLTLTEADNSEYYSVLLAPQETPTTLIYSVIDCEIENRSDPDQCPPFIPDIYAQLDIPGDLYFAQFNITTDEFDARLADNPTVPVLVRTPQGIAIQRVWRVVHQYLYNLADGLHRNETNGVLWIAPTETNMPSGALLCSPEQENGDPGSQMPGYDVMFCAADMKHDIYNYCFAVPMESISALDLGVVAEEWGLDSTGEIYDVFDAVSEPCEVLSYIFGWTDLHYLAAAYYLEINAGATHDPTITVLPMQPYRGKWATVGGTRKAMEKMELTFAPAGVEFEDTKAPVKFPSGWTQNTEAGLNDFSAYYNHDVNGALSALMVLRFGRIERENGDMVNGLVGGIGGATDGTMTTDSWGYANNGWGAHIRNLWTSHEAAHLFAARHSDTACWTGYEDGHWGGRQHQSIMGTTSDEEGKPDHCNEWSGAHFHMTLAVHEIQKVRPHACSISIMPCSSIM